MDRENKRAEELKRDRAYDPAERWKQIQRMIAWAEANLPEHLRRNRPRAKKTTLAEKLGRTTHLSPLLRKLQSKSDERRNLGAWLRAKAVARGATHYGLPEVLDRLDELTDEELGVALCLGHLDYDPANIRIAAQLLSSPAISSRKLAHLSIQERCDDILSYIAAAAERVNPSLHPWADLRRLLKPRVRIPDGTLPHWTRFVSYSGVTRTGVTHLVWLMRDE